MTGAGPDRLAIEARRALLDALTAFEKHHDALILVGAQAIYLRTGEADIAVAPFTKDSDLAIDPRRLEDRPTLDEAMRSAGFEPGDQPGIWRANTTAAQIDLLVPETLSGRGGRRGARLQGHGTRAARRVAGMEGAIVDNSIVTLESLEASDGRRHEVRVAGPAALLVSKLHKISERRDQPGRLLDKDALDVYRLLVATSTSDLAGGLRRLLADPISSAAASEGVEHLRLFATVDGLGSRMAARAAGPLTDPNTVAQACAALTGDLLQGLG